MKKMYDLSKSFEYENGFYATADVDRISKFITHYELFKQTSNLRGEIVEFGVFKGNSLFRWIKFRDLIENTYSRQIIAFDMFGEFPETDFENDKKERLNFIEETGGGIGISIEELTDILQKQELNKNVNLIKGNILETLPQFIEKNPQLKISLLHIDVDLYEATNIALTSLFEYVVPGGIIIFDDYGDFAGANKAIDDFFQGKKEIKKLPFSSHIAYIVK